MKQAIFIPTGEEIDIITCIDVPTKTAWFYEAGDEKRIPIPVELLSFPANQEQRRYELAKEFMQQRLSNESDIAYIERNYQRFATLAVCCADALLNALDVKPKDNDDPNSSSN